MENKSTEYYKIKYYVVESMYEKIVDEDYSFAQAIDRCLVEFWKQVSDGGLNALAVYSTLFSRAAYHAPETLKRFRKHIDNMNNLLTTKIESVLSEDETEELMDDIDLINHSVREFGAK